MFCECKCCIPPFNFQNFSKTHLGEDASGAEITLDRCTHCGQLWLNYLIEDPSFSHSTRWWRVVLTLEQKQGISAATSRGFIEQQAWCFIGGSYYGSSGNRSEAPIRIC